MQILLIYSDKTREPPVLNLATLLLFGQRLRCRLHVSWKTCLADWFNLNLFSLIIAVSDITYHLSEWVFKNLKRWTALKEVISSPALKWEQQMNILVWLRAVAEKLPIYAFHCRSRALSSCQLKLWPLPCESLLQPLWIIITKLEIWEYGKSIRFGQAMSLHVFMHTV